MLHPASFSYKDCLHSDGRMGHVYRASRCQAFDFAFNCKATQQQTPVDYLPQVR